MRHRHKLSGLLPPLMVAVVLGGAFGEASAEGRSLTSGMIQVEISVEVSEARTVVAHVIEPGGGQETLPLVARGNNLFTATIELRKADFIIVFEALGEALSTQSQPVSLTELGLDPSLIGASPITTSDDGGPNVTRQWGWAALALAALSLALLAWWAMPDRTRQEPEPDQVSG